MRVEIYMCGPNFKKNTTLKNLNHITELKEASVVFGFYDVIYKIQASDNKTLANINTKSIRSLH